MHALPGACRRGVEEDVQPLGPTMNESWSLQRLTRSLEIGTPNHDVHVSRVPHRGLVHGRDPCRDGVPARDGVVHAAGPKGVCRTEQTSAALFHGVDHPLENDVRLIGQCGHAGSQVAPPRRPSPPKAAAANGPGLPRVPIEPCTGLRPRLPIQDRVPLRLALDVPLLHLGDGRPGSPYDPNGPLGVRRSRPDSTYSLSGRTSRAGSPMLLEPSKPLLRRTIRVRQRLHAPARHGPHSLRRGRESTPGSARTFAKQGPQFGHQARSARSAVRGRFQGTARSRTPRREAGRSHEGRARPDRPPRPSPRTYLYFPAIFPSTFAMSKSTKSAWWKIHDSIVRSTLSPSWLWVATMCMTSGGRPCL